MHRRTFHLSPAQERFIVERFRREWVKAEALAKRHELIQKAKIAGATVGQTLLALLLLTGSATMAAVAPNAFVAFGRDGRLRRHFQINNRNLKNNLNYGSSKSYWRFSKMQNGEYRINLTPKGRQIVLRRPREKVGWQVANGDL